MHLNGSKFNSVRQLQCNNRSRLMRRDSRLKEHIGLVSVNVRLLKVLQNQTSSDQRTRLVQIFKFGSGLQLVFHTYHF